MIIYPAIDIIDGKAVRLTRGDYEQITVYDDDPMAVAMRFKNAGVRALHIVDLEGAREGRPVNDGLIKDIAAHTGLFIQTGGGIRTAGTVQQYIKAGARRIILGTAAVSVPGFLREMIALYGEIIAVGADIKDGFVATHGWTELSTLDVYAFSDEVRQAGVGTIICTDISKDGMQSGTNIELYKTLRRKLPDIRLIASGGVSSLKDIAMLDEIGMDGVILGKALYEKSIELSELSPWFSNK